MKLALALPPLLVTSARSACEVNSDGKLVKPDTPEADWDVSCVTNMDILFMLNTHNADLGDWDVSKVTNMMEMFYAAKNFNGDLSDWDVSKVTNMEGMFQRAYEFNGDLGDWDVSKVTTTESMFEDASKFNADLGDWDVSEVTNMAFMFKSEMILPDELVTEVGAREDCVNGLGDSTKKIVATDGPDEGKELHCYDMYTPFYSDNCKQQWIAQKCPLSCGMCIGHAFNRDLGAWDVSKVTNMHSMFRHATAFNADLSAWDVSQVTNMIYLFEGATAFNAPLNWCIVDTDVIGADSAWSRTECECADGNGNVAFATDTGKWLTCADLATPRYIGNCGVAKLIESCPRTCGHCCADREGEVLVATSGADKGKPLTCADIATPTYIGNCGVVKEVTDSCPRTCGACTGPGPNCGVVARADCTTCGANEYVRSGKCEKCLDGWPNDAGDQPWDDDTVCDGVSCPANHLVKSQKCVECSAGTFNAAGDKTLKGDTNCAACTKAAATPYATDRQCGTEGPNLGTAFGTRDECALAAVKSGCDHIMWSDTYNYAWGCRCCSAGGEKDGGRNTNWDIYDVTCDATLSSSYYDFTAGSLTASNGLTAALHGNAKQGTTVSASNGIALDGSSGTYISLPGLALDTWPGTGFTIEVCADVPAGGGGGTWARLFDFGTGTAVNMFLTATPVFAMTKGGWSQEDVVSHGASLAGKSACLAVTSDFKLYKDGVLLSKTCVSDSKGDCDLDLADLKMAGANYYVGRSQYAADPYLKATIRAVRVSDSVLGASDMLDYAKAVGSRACFSDPGVGVKNCVCHSSCATCGYTDQPDTIGDCVTCAADGATFSKEWDDWTGICSGGSGGGGGGGGGRAAVVIVVPVVCGAVLVAAVVYGIARKRKTAAKEHRASSMPSVAIETSTTD